MSKYGRFIDAARLTRLECRVTALVYGVGVVDSNLGAIDFESDRQSDIGQYPCRLAPPI